MDIKPKATHPDHRSALTAFPTFRSILSEAEREVRQHGQIRPHPDLSRDRKANFACALAAYGGADFIRGLGGLPVSSAAVGRARQDPGVLIADLNRITGGNPGMSSRRIARRRGGYGIIASIRRRMGLVANARAAAGADPGIKTGERSLRVRANFEARLRELMAAIRANPRLTIHQARRNFYDVINALKHHNLAVEDDEIVESNRPMTFNDIKKGIGQPLQRRQGRHALRRPENLLPALTPYMLGGRLDTARMYRKKKWALLKAIEHRGGVRAVEGEWLQEKWVPGSVQPSAPILSGNQTNLQQAHEEMLRKAAERRLRRQFGL